MNKIALTLMLLLVSATAAAQGGACDSQVSLRPNGMAYVRCAGHQVECFLTWIADVTPAPARERGYICTDSTDDAELGLGMADTSLQDPDYGPRKHLVITDNSRRVLYQNEVPGSAGYSFYPIRLEAGMVPFAVLISMAEPDEGGAVWTRILAFQRGLLRIVYTADGPVMLTLPTAGAEGATAVSCSGRMAWNPVSAAFFSLPGGSRPGGC